MKSVKNKGPAVACRAQGTIYIKETITYYCIIVKSISTENYANIIAAEVKND
jgi:hypothetical protein